MTTNTITSLELLDSIDLTKTPLIQFYKDPNVNLGITFSLKDNTDVTVSNLKDLNRLSYYLKGLVGYEQANKWFPNGIVETNEGRVVNRISFVKHSRRSKL